jgi:ribA/ribD-fused uncharacterized protein
VTSRLFHPTRLELEALRDAVSAGCDDAERIIREDRYPGSVRDARANLPEWRRLHEQLLVAAYPKAGPPAIDIADHETVIDRFADKYAVLSNFHRSPVHWGPWRYPTVEHAFQAAKTSDLDARARICGAATPRQAKQLGRQVDLRPDWETVKFGVMAELVARKFADDTRASVLLATGDAYLIEGNTWGDTTWGAVRSKTLTDAPWVGWNQLGRILMSVRRRLRVEWPVEAPAGG